MSLFPDRQSGVIYPPVEKGYTRRFILKAALAFPAAVLPSACSSSQDSKENSKPFPVPVPRPPETYQPENFIDDGLRKIGVELENWSIKNGRKMVDLYDEVRQVRDLLTGKVDPRIYLPNLKLPLRLGVETPDRAASLSIKPNENPRDTRKIQIRFATGVSTDPISWLNNPEVSVRLSTEVQNMGTGKLPVVVKELIQFITLLKVYKIYLDNTPNTKALFLNPANIPTRIEDILYNQGKVTEAAEDTVLKYSPLSELIDLGGGVGIGGLVYGTSLLNDQISSSNLQQPGPMALQRYLDFLKRENLVKEESGHMVWAVLGPPIIGTIESIIQTDKYIRKHFPGKSILESY